MEGRADDRTTLTTTTQVRENVRPLTTELWLWDCGLLVYCYVGRESVHALIVPTYTSHNLLMRITYNVTLIDFATVTL